MQSLNAYKAEQHKSLSSVKALMMVSVMDITYEDAPIHHRNLAGEIVMSKPPAILFQLFSTLLKNFRMMMLSRGPRKSGVGC